MEIEIDLTESAQENANEYFSRAKRAKRKREGAEASIGELEKRLDDARARLAKVSGTRMIRSIEDREWYEKFHWFFTSNGMLAIGGRDALQNELINSRYFESRDLFFHADVFGADVVVLKNGSEASRETREEAAQFAACHSSAWKQGLSSADVYSLRREQVSKSKEKGSLGVGSFALSGEREWYRSMRLELVAFVSKRVVDQKESRRLFVVPSKTPESMHVTGGIRVTPGDTKKSDAAKSLGKRLGYDYIDYIMQQLPAGSFHLSL